MKKFPVNLDFSKQKIMSLYEDSFGYIWAGTFGQGIIRINPKTGEQAVITEKDGLVNGNVLSIKGSDKEIWFATLGGASRCQIDDKLASLHFIPHFDNYGKAEGLANNYIYDLFIDPQGRTWFATDGNGIFVFTDDKFINIAKGSLFENKVIYSVTGDDKGNIWINSASEGLYHYDGNNFTSVQYDADVQKMAISGITCNNSDEMVIEYSKGFDVLNTQTNRVIHYEQNAGLIGFESDLNTLAKDKEGNVWIGFSNGLIHYSSPGTQFWNKPKTCINDISVYLVKYDFKKIHEFPANQNHFSFNYIGLWYQYPEKVRYEIKLEGHDLDWIKTKDKNVIYSNLSPGNYTFRVRSGLNDNFENVSTATYSFRINKPYWATWWFYLIVVVVIGSVIAWYIYAREKRLKRKQELLREQIRSQFENLKNQINPHFLFNSFSTLIALIETDTDSAVEYVGELSNLFRSILEYKDQDIIRLEEELKIVENYYNLQRKRYGKNLILTLNIKPEFMSLKIPPMTLQMLIENAIKHNIISKDKPLDIEIFCDEKKEMLYVENNLQPMKENVVSTGTGIKNILNRYRLLTDKKIEIAETALSFKVGLPFIR